MKTSYRWFWRFTLVLVAGAFCWTQFGRAWVRRNHYLPPPPAEITRTEDYFVAVVFPKITKRPAPYAMAQKDFEETLRSLQSLGYHTIGLEDVRRLYTEHRLLPPKSILIALDRDEPRSVKLADISMKKFHQRGVIFLKGGAARKGRYKRRWLSKHVISQMRKGGAWQFGEEPGTDQTQEFREFVYRTKKDELHFTVAQSGFNDGRQDPRSLNIMRVRPDREIQESILLIHKNQPRRIEHVDKFDAPRFRSEWLIGWGAASGSNNKMVILPMPGRTSAAVFLTGTEDWQDMVIEFKLEKFKKNVFVYCRYQDLGRYVRVGATEGYWLVEQKSGLGPPTVLAKIPMKDSDLPTTVRLLLKGQWAVLYLNGSMQLGKAMRVDRAIDRGRVHVGVFDKEHRAAMAVFSYLRAKPLGTKWIALKRDDLSSPAMQDTLRQELVETSVISPHWFKINSEGEISSTAQERETVWFQAGYYRCRLMPLLDIASSGFDFKLKEAAAKKLQAELAEQVNQLGVDGINIVLSPSQAKQAVSFLEGLREKLHAAKHELWVTYAEEPDPIWLSKVDGVLKPMGQPIPGLEILHTTRFMRPGSSSRVDSMTEAAL